MFTQPSPRYLVIEPVEAEHGAVGGVAGARGENRHNISIASDTMVLDHGLAGFDFEVRFPPFVPLMSTRRAIRSVDGHKSPVIWVTHLW
jgi:hypothetical protein